MSNEKSRNIANNGIQSYITKLNQKSFILSVYCIALFTEGFEPPHSLSMSKKKKIFGLIVLNFVKKLFYKTVLCYVQGTRKKLEIASFMEQA